MNVNYQKTGFPLICGIIIIASVVLIGCRSQQEETPQGERKTTSGRMINVELEPINTDLLEESGSLIIMINSKNEIQAERCVLRRRADTGAFASGHSAATTDKPFNQLLSVQS